MNHNTLAKYNSLLRFYFLVYFFTSNQLLFTILIYYVAHSMCLYFRVRKLHSISQ